MSDRSFEGLIAAQLRLIVALGRTAALIAEIRDDRETADRDNDPESTGEMEAES